jgi:hypothetical protein
LHSEGHRFKPGVWLSGLGFFCDIALPSEARWDSSSCTIRYGCLLTPSLTESQLHWQGKEIRENLSHIYLAQRETALWNHLCGKARLLAAARFRPHPTAMLDTSSLRCSKHCQRCSVCPAPNAEPAPKRPPETSRAAWRLSVQHRGSIRHFPRRAGITF